LSRLWPVGEAAQADYENLRSAVLAGLAPVGEAATRFEAEGLRGLIRRPVAEAVFTACLHGPPGQPGRLIPTRDWRLLQTPTPFFSAHRATGKGTAWRSRVSGREG